MCQSSFIALSCKISLLSRQRTTTALIRMRGCAGRSAPLLFTCDKSRFSHDVANKFLMKNISTRRGIYSHPGHPRLRLRSRRKIVFEVS